MQNEPEEIDGDPFDSDQPTEEDTLSARNMAARIGAYCRGYPEGLSGIHFLVDDLNVDTDTVFLSIETAQNRGDKKGLAIASDMLLMTEGERYFACVHKYEY